MRLKTRDRFNVGKVTRTDVAQSESRLAAGRSQLLTAESNYTTSRANYRQVIGVDPPARLAPAMGVDRFCSSTLAGVLARASTQHPSITTAAYNVDVAVYQVKVAEGALYPVLQLQGAANQAWGNPNNLNTLQTTTANTITTQLSVPIYKVGVNTRPSGRPRKRSASGGSALDAARDQVRAQATQAWGRFDRQGADQGHPGAVAASEIALNGVREEARVGQRTTLDVLQRSAGSGQCAGFAGDSRARPGGRFLLVLSATGGLSPRILRSRRPDLRSNRALP